ncbi:MAG: sugar phosphate isomerase/epimerase [Phycisphaerales bacterium]|nr:sugar phosphate isomerase/epimerase [Phycisphaerales bacterium]
MLLTLAANSLRSYLRPDRTGAQKLRLIDLPRFARDEFGLHGLNFSTDLLAGSDYERLDQVRDAADKACCPCLVLVESEPQAFAEEDDDLGDVAVDRLIRVAKAANRLGCNSMALTISGVKDADDMDRAAERLKDALRAAERLEVNVLLGTSPSGLLALPDSLTDLIKKVGGFRVGTFPDFQAASNSADPPQYLRRLTPYAQGVTASVVTFKAPKKGGPPAHEPYDLVEYTKAIASVGYTGTLAIEVRGEGDPAATIRSATAVLQGALGAEADQS